jgi:hypothetical protein
MTSLLKNLTNNFTDEELALRQVIVNTHSPIFVNEVYKWENDRNVSIWYAAMVNRVTDIDGVRMKLSVTDINKVEKDLTYQLNIFIPEAQRKMTLAKIQEYLTTTGNL